MAKRKSGNVEVQLVYRDTNDYHCRMYVDGARVWTGDIRPAPIGFGEGVAYDSAAAYDSIARSAISFAEHWVKDADFAYEVETVDGCDSIKLVRG